MGKQRARVTKWGTYTPEKTVNYETYVKELYAVSYPNTKLQGALAIEILAHISIPKSASKKKQKEMLDGTIRPIKKPDASNILKIIEDALNKVAYDDDSQIVDVAITKEYSMNPRIYLELWEVNNEQITV
jgi:Holliday junction resolvase RusA-like endonuclease